MDFLIIGGLFALALVAIIALVFVIRSDSSIGNREARTAQTTSATSDVPVVPIQPAEGGISQVPTTVSLPTSALSHSSADDETLTDQEEFAHFPVSNGQFHELSVELHTLREQAQEMEIRLNRLTDMIERIERTQTIHSDFESQTFRPANDTSSIH